MYNVTKFKILKPASEVFEAFVDPAEIGNFWFSSSSERWEQGKTITLKYDLFNAEGQITVLEISTNEKIVFKWGPKEEEHVVTINLNDSNGTTLIEISEAGFKDEQNEDLVSQMLDNKEGWVFMLSCLKAYLEHGVTDMRAGLVK